MSAPPDRFSRGTDPRNSRADAPAGDRRRDDTLTRLRSALAGQRLSLLDLTGEDTGTDPYNSGVHRALAQTYAWRKRAR